MHAYHTIRKLNPNINLKYEILSCLKFPSLRYVSIYVSTCTCHLPRICCTLVPEICVRPETLRVFWSIDMLMCDLQLSSTEHQGQLELLIVF